MNTKNEIKEIKDKIYNARVYINANFDVSKDPEGKNMSDKVLEAFETEHSAQDKLKQLQLKAEKEKNLTKKIKALKTLGIEVLLRERDYDASSYNFINGFYPEKISVKLKFGSDYKIVPLRYQHDAFYISYKDHGGMALFDVFEDKVEDEHLFYTGRA